MRDNAPRLPRRLLVSVAMLALGAGFAGASLAGRSAQVVTFHVSVRDFDSIDPAVSYVTGSWAVQNLTCARLMRYVDRAPPAGYRIVPEAAEAWPRVSRDRKRYVFTIRRGLRFSNGQRLTARNFAYALRRLRDPRQASPIGFYVESIARVMARGRRLIIELKTPSADLPPRMTMPFFCPVPLGLPLDPEGVNALPGSGPYYVSTYTRGRRIVLLRNRRYAGNRPHRIDRFVFHLDDEDLDPAATIARVERGERDWGELPPVLPTELASRLRRTYGLNRGRYFVRPSTIVQILNLNSARPLFRRNVRLRQAVNFALDRRALLALFGRGWGAPTDQLLPPGFPGHRHANVYPLDRPNVRKARALASGHRRGGKAVMYYPLGTRGAALAQIVQRNMASIGIDVQLRGFPHSFPASVFVEKLSTRGEPWDLAILPWQPEYVDPYGILNVLLGRGTGFIPLGFDSPTYNRLLGQAARKTGRARYRTYGALDVRISRDAAPVAPIGYPYGRNFVSRRYGCALFNASAPGAPDLAAACVRR